MSSLAKQVHVEPSALGKLPLPTHKHSSTNNYLSASLASSRSHGLCHRDRTRRVQTHEFHGFAVSSNHWRWLSMHVGYSESWQLWDVLTVSSFGSLEQAIFKLFEYMKQNNYKTPSSISDGPLQYAYKTKNNMFEHLHANPPYGLNFNNHMGGYRQGRPSWMDEGFFPVQDKLLNGADTTPGATLLVDVGGGLGHDIREFLSKYPDTPGRLVLQDLPVVISQIEELDQRIERTEHDFTLEQPIKGQIYEHSSKG